MRRVLLLSGLLAGCAGPIVTACHDKGHPYTHERPTVPFHTTVTNSRGVDSWTADGAPTVLTIHNPTDQYRQVHVVCDPSVDMNYIDRGHIEGWFCMKPHTEMWRLAEFMNRDAINQVCSVVDEEISTPETCYRKDQQ